MVVKVITEVMRISRLKVCTSEVILILICSALQGTEVAVANF